MTSSPSTSKPGMVRGTEPGGQDDVGAGDLGGRAVVAGDPDPVAGEQGPAAVEDLDAPALHQPGQALEQLVDHLLLAGLADREVEGGGGAPAPSRPALIPNCPEPDTVR